MRNAGPYSQMLRKDLSQGQAEEINALETDKILDFMVKND